MAATAVDTFSVPSCFTTFPVYIHEDERDIARCEDTVPKVVRELAPHLNVRLHSIGPYGNVFAFCYPTGLTDRVGLNAEIVEALWIYDDVIEALPHEEAAKLHDSLYALLDRGCSEPSLNQNWILDIFRESWAPALDCSDRIEPSDAQDWVLEMFQDFPSRVKALDPVGAQIIMDVLKTYIKEYDSIDANFTTVGEYVEFRRVNAGFDLMEGFMRWDCDIRLTPAEVAASRDYGAAAGAAMALTNDYFSWASEKGDSMGRQHNAVSVVMRLHGVGEEYAKTFVKGLVIEAEEKTRRLGLELAKDASEEMKRYLDAMGYMLGGHLFWSATCPRYNAVS